MRYLILLSVLVLAGCGSTPVFLGGSDDGTVFIARVTRFSGETALPGVLRAIGTDRGVSADGCQLSMRGAVPRGVAATLHAGQCHAELWQEPPEPEAAGTGDYSGWVP
jgi:hypothetical protein